MRAIVKAHESFIVDRLLPVVVDYAESSNTSMDEVLLAVFVAFSVFVSMHGRDPAAVLETARLERLRDGYAMLHEASETLQ